MGLQTYTTTSFTALGIASHFKFSAGEALFISRYFIKPRYMHSILENHNMSVSVSSLFTSVTEIEHKLDETNKKKKQNKIV